MVCIWNHSNFPVRWGSEMGISLETLSLATLAQTVVNTQEMLSRRRLKVKTDTWGCLLIFTLVLCRGIGVHMYIQSYHVYAQRKHKNKQTYKWKTILSFVPFKVNIDCKEQYMGRCDCYRLEIYCSQLWEIVLLCNTNSLFTSREVLSHHGKILNK